MGKYLKQSTERDIDGQNKLYNDWLHPTGIHINKQTIELLNENEDEVETILNTIQKKNKNKVDIS